MSRFDSGCSGWGLWVPPPGVAGSARPHLATRRSHKQISPACKLTSSRCHTNNGAQWLLAQVKEAVGGVQQKLADTAAGLAESVAHKVQVSGGVGAWGAWAQARVRVCVQKGVRPEREFCMLQESTWGEGFCRCMRPVEYARASGTAPLPHCLAVCRCMHTWGRRRCETTSPSCPRARCACACASGEQGSAHGDAVCL